METLRHHRKKFKGRLPNKSKINYSEVREGYESACLILLENMPNNGLT